MEKFELFFTNPGFHLVLENIFLNLNFDDLSACEQINKFCKNVLNNPNFWLKKFTLRGLSKENQNDWETAIGLAKDDSGLENDIMLYLKISSKHVGLYNLPCYITEDIIFKSTELIKKFGPEKAYLELKNLDKWSTLAKNNKDNLDDSQVVEYFGDCGPGLIQILLAPIANDIKEQKNFNNSDEADPFILCFYPLFIHTALVGHLEAIKALVPLIRNPNFVPKNDNDNEIFENLDESNQDINPDELAQYSGKCAIHFAADQGHLEIVKFLSKLVDNPNPQDTLGFTPIYHAASEGHLEIVKYLASVISPIDDVMLADYVEKMTPIHTAALDGHSEIIKFLCDFTKKNPLLLLDSNGKSPLDYAIESRSFGQNTVESYDECIRFLKSFIK